MISKRIWTYLMALLLLVSCPLYIAPTVAADWIPSATLSGGLDGTAYHQETADLFYNLQISSIRHSRSVEISSFKIQLDWESSPTEVLSSPVDITLPGSYAFHRSVLIPQAVSDGPHIASISVTGQAARDWFPSTQTWSLQVTVGTRPALQLSISGSPSEGTAPLVVGYTSTVNGGLPPYTFAWTFGDGTTSSDPNPTHVYAEAGTYQVSLAVTDSQSRQKTYQGTVTVGEPQKADSMPSDGRFTILGVIFVMVAITVLLLTLLGKKRRGDPPNGPKTR